MKKCVPKTRLKATACEPLKQKALVTAVALAMSGAVHANPQGLSVAAGQASATALGSLMEIRNTPGAILNWQQFNIEAGETTRFIQDSAASAVFNRVTGGDASKILGTLQSNGQVFLINPNGILFGAGAVVDTAGFLASTLAATDADLLAGRLSFENGGQAGSIQNLGQLNAHSGGSVVLIAPQVENNGIIHAEGEILLAAGHHVTVVDLQYPSVGLKVEAKVGDSAINLGEVIGKNASFFGSLVGNQGHVEATGVEFGEGGTIRFVGDQGVNLAAGSSAVASGSSGGTVEVKASQGDALVAGSIQANGSDGSGGTVNVTGQRVALLDGADVQANGGGTGDGGLVQIGGGWQGKEADLQNSTYTVMQNGTSISANAGTNGDGGEVVLWSDDRTDFSGHIAAKGGSVSGRGGMVETSGKQTLQANGRVNVASVDGGGQYLLDPGDIEIVALAPTAEPTIAPSPAPGPAPAPVVFQSPTTAPTVSFVETGTLATALETGNGADVIVTTAGSGNGNITLVDPLLTVTPSVPASSLKLIADGGIFLNADIDLRSLPGTRLDLTANGAIELNANVFLDSADIVANYNVDAGLRLNGQFDNNLGFPPPLLVLNPFVLDSSRQPGPNAAGLVFDVGASTPVNQFDLNFGQFADSGGRFGASVTPVNFVTDGTSGLPYSFGVISTTGVDVEFRLPEDVSLFAGGNPLSVEVLDIDSDVSFARNVSTQPLQSVEVNILDLFIGSNGKLILNPFTFASISVEGSLRTEVGAELILNGNPDPEANANPSFGLFNSGAVFDVTGLGGILEPTDANGNPFAPGTAGLTIRANGFDSRIQNDAFQQSVLTIGPSVNILVDAGTSFAPFESGSSLVPNLPDIEDVLTISNYDSNTPMMSVGGQGFVGTVNVQGKARTDRGGLLIQGENISLSNGALTANGAQAAVLLESNSISNGLINNGIVRTNGALLGLTGLWDNTGTGTNPFAQGTIFGSKNLTVSGGSINPGANRFVVVDETLLNLRGVSLTGNIHTFAGSAMVMGYSGQGTGTMSTLNNAQINMAGYSAILVEGNAATGVATLGGTGVIRSANQGNVIVASNAIPPGTQQ
ncbi:MAG: filamentous hemagglutinin N-terminal domain-containing protein, partial [Limnobacter sp.]|nr:filamentous hemagglutinin N-terminal domain-containing protein [Limnobacter sp.]